MSQLSSPKGDGKPKWDQKLCQLCAQWSPIANTLTILVNVISGTRMGLQGEIMGNKVTVLGNSEIHT